MDSIISKNYSQIQKYDVSRETCNDFESLIGLIQEKNMEINIISKKTSEKEALRNGSAVSLASGRIMGCSTDDEHDYNNDADDLIVTTI